MEAQALALINLIDSLEAHGFTLAPLGDIQSLAF